MTFAVRYDRATTPTRGPQPGALALYNAILYLYDGAYGLGVYNNRSIRGSKALSVHAEGRAMDIGFKMVSGRGNPKGWTLANDLVKLHKEFGIQNILWDGKSFRPSRSSLWRSFSSSAGPHYDHLHIELTREAARELTPNRVAEIFRGSTPLTDPISNTLRSGHRGPAVSGLQSILAFWGYYDGAIDGVFGPATERAVRQLQIAIGVSADGVWGSVSQARYEAWRSALANTSDRLVAGEALGVGQRIQSASGRYVLILQPDGNLVLYDAHTNTALWHTHTYGSVANQLFMQPDGNLVLYAPGSVALWHTHTYRYPGASLLVQDDGNLVLYGADGTALWSVR